MKDDDIPYEEDDDEQNVITANSDQIPTEDDPDTENLIIGAAQKLADMMISDVCIQSPQ